jgi:hydrogenase/urease accessory protein HupE
MNGFAEASACRRRSYRRGARGGTLLAVLLALLLAGVARAHPLAPALLDLRESGGGEVAVTWKVSALRAPGVDVRPVLPANCRPRADSFTTTEEEGGIVTRWTVSCGPAGLVGERIGILGLEAAKIDGLLRASLADGRHFQTVLRAREPFATVPERPRRTDVARAYAVFGIEHILTGGDHLLFVFGLLMLVSGAAPLVRTVTAFTVGHSVTLSLAALGVARLPAAPIEATIAASVLALAVELARRPAAAPTALRRFPWVMALAFGLLHGLGFAGALREVGLPSGEIPLALLAFNCGIELGQLAFVAVVLCGRWLLGRAAVRLPAWTYRVPVYAMGSLAAFWCIERGVAIFQ